MKSGKIIIPGGSGFLGRTLASWFAARGYEVIVLSRHPTTVPYATVQQWDARSLGAWQQALEGADAVINLAGRSVNCRYNAANRKQMQDSRVESTRVLGKAIAACENPPKVWLNSSTATIYRHRHDAPNTERDGLYGATAEAKDAYSLEVAHAWEDAFTEAYAENDLTNTRGLILRTAMVFGNEPGGVYQTLRRLARLGLGGTMAGGRQFVSWLHEEDFCRAIEWMIDNQEAEGIYNLTVPKPIPNQKMMAELRRANGARVGLPATRWMLELGAIVLRTETELIFKSRYVIPERLQEEGFRFEHPEFAEALGEIESRARD